MSTHTAIAIFVPLLWLLGFASGRSSVKRARRMPGLYLRPTGKPAQRASDPMRDGGQPTPATDITALISSYSPPGDPSAGRVYRQQLLHRNRLTGLGLSGNVTVIPGKSGEHEPSAAFREHINRCVETIIRPAVEDLPPDADRKTRAEMLAERLLIHRNAGDFMPPAGEPRDSAA